MDFTDFETTLPAAGGPISVRVTASVLHGLWSEYDGPQTPEAIVESHREIIDEIAADKLLEGRIEQGVVVIYDYDVDF